MTVHGYKGFLVGAGVALVLGIVVLLSHVGDRGRRPAADRTSTALGETPAPHHTEELEHLQRENERLRLEIARYLEDLWETQEADASERAIPDGGGSSDPDDLKSRVAALRRALSEGDKEEAWRLGLRLARVIKGDTDRALALISILAEEEDRLVAGFLGLVLGHGRTIRDETSRRAVVALLSEEIPPAAKHGVTVALAQAAEEDPSILEELGPADWDILTYMAEAVEYEGMRTGAVRLLGHNSSDADVAQVLERVLLGSTDPRDREAALDVLSSLPRESAGTPVLTALDEDENAEMRGETARALALMSPEEREDTVFHTLEPAILGEKEWGVRLGMLLAMVRLDPDRALAALEQIMVQETDPEMQARFQVIRDLMAGGETDLLELVTKSRTEIQKLENR